jgi:hypothetical protein
MGAGGREGRMGKIAPDHKKHRTALLGLARGAFVVFAGAIRGIFEAASATAIRPRRAATSYPASQWRHEH